MERIKSFQEQIDLFDKLKIEEAQELYMNAINSSDEKLKKLYLDKVILGTLYVVNNYIERNNLKIFQGSQYDIDDIRSAFTEIWVRKIKNGELLTVDKYSLIFTSTFFNEVYKNLVGSEMIINEQFGITTEHLIDLFHAYVQLKNAGKDFNFDDLMNQFYQEKRYYFNRVFYCSKDDILLLLLEGMYNSLNFDKEDDLDITKNKIGDFIKLFVNSGLYDRISNDIVSDDMLEDVLNNVMYEHFIEDVDEILIDERKRMVVHQRYGLDGETPKNLDEIANQFGVTSERIRQMDAKALRDLRVSKKMKKYIK